MLPRCWCRPGDVYLLRPSVTVSTRVLERPAHARDIVRACVTRDVVVVDIRWTSCCQTCHVVSRVDREVCTQSATQHNKCTQSDRIDNFSNACFHFQAVFIFNMSNRVVLTRPWAKIVFSNMRILEEIILPITGSEYRYRNKPKCQILPLRYKADPYVHICPVWLKLHTPVDSLHTWRSEHWCSKLKHSTLAL